jgi:hypothetical protein
MNKAILAIVVTLVVLAVVSTGNACDFCLLSQGISPLDTMKGTGIKVSERYTVLDQVYQGTREKTNPGRKGNALDNGADRVLRDHARLHGHGGAAV